MSEGFPTCAKLIFCILPVSQIVIGALYQHDCPKQPFIPIYLEVMGAFSLLYSAISCLCCPHELSPYFMVLNIVNLLIGFHLFFTYWIIWILCSCLLSCLPYSASFWRHSKAWSGLVALFFFCWFIAGNWWIYSIYQPNYNKTTTDVDPYCDKTLYLFAFWTTNLFYIQIPLLIGFCVFCPEHLAHVETDSGYQRY